ncbi:MAG: hypothetical protein RR891_09845 [Clostridium sp.]|uniref:hypothetical protein n=1 Tax=Clostridium sp. TaxID=1506 RepID=UPI00305739E8
MEHTTFKLKDEDNNIKYEGAKHNFEHENNNLMLLNQLFFNTKSNPTWIDINQYESYKGYRD